MARGRRPATPAHVGIVLGAVAVVAYALTRTRDLGGDDTVFATAVDLALRGGDPGRELLHVHHPLYNPLVLVVAQVFRLVGATVFVPDIGAWVAAAGAALVVGGLVPVLRRAGLGEAASLLGATLAAVSGGLWMFATVMEVYTLTAAAVLLWLAVAGRDRPRGAPCGGALLGVMLGHLSAGLLVVPTAWRLRRDRPALARALAVGLGLAATVWLALLTLAHGSWSPHAWRELLFGGPEGGYLGAPRPLAALGALRNLTLWTWFARPGVWPPAAVQVGLVLGGAAVVVVALLVVRGLVEAWVRRPPLAVTAALGLGAYLPLWLLWDAGNVEHTVAAVPLLATLAAFGADAFGAAVGRVALGAAVAVLAVVNGVGSALPASRPENCRVWVTAAEVARRLPSGAELLAVGADARLRLGLPYLSGRRVIDLTMAVEGARRQGLSPADGLRAWVTAAGSSRELWALPDVLDPASSRTFAALGLSESAWQQVAGSIFTGESLVIPADGVALREPFVLTRVALARPTPP